jgi:MFS family permease
MGNVIRKWHGLPWAFWYLWLGVIVKCLGGFVVTFLAIYLTGARGFSVESAGFVVSLYGAGSLCAGPLGGALADRIGRRTTLLISLLGTALALLNLGFARSSLRIAMGAAVFGCLNDLARPAVGAAIADLVPAEDRTRAYGLLYWGVNLGFAGAAVLAGLLARYDFSLLFIGDATAATLFGLLVLLRVPETLPTVPPAAPSAGSVPRSSLLAPYQDSVFVTFIAIQFAVAWVLCQSTSSLPLDLSRHGVSTSRYGQLIALNGILLVLLQPLLMRVIGRVPRARALALGALLAGGGFGMCALGHSQLQYAISIVVWTLGEIVLSLVVPTLIADLAPRELRGSYQGGYQLSWGAASLLGPSLGALVLGRHGSRSLWLLCLALGSMAAGLHLACAPARRRRLLAMPEAEAALLRETPAGKRD